MKLEQFLSEEILELNKMHYNDLKNKVEAGKVTWVLGAGISVPAGLPQWDELLAKMWVRLSEIEIRDAFVGEEKKDRKYFLDARKEKLNKITDFAFFRNKVNDAFDGKYKNIFEGTNVLESAEYMWNYIENLIGEAGNKKTREELQERILKALIRDSVQISESGKNLKDNLLESSVGILAKILAAKKKGNVITYNYDDILEFCLEEIEGLDSGSVEVICDCDEEKGEKEGKVNIHHPHGSLNITGSNLGKESEHIILTESSYYQMEQKLYCWENSVQAKALVETGCIFMGFSGEDYNFRRIIKNVGFNPDTETPRHYIFFCIDKLVKTVYESETVDVGSEEYVYEGIQLINRLYVQYTYWMKHGIVPIWSTYEELPNMMKELSIFS